MRSPAEGFPCSAEHPLVLGSGSPRRRELLDAARVPHVVHKAEIDESLLEGEDADAYLERIARAKLLAVAAALPSELRARVSCLLVADTSVVLDGAVLGKPTDAADAERLVGRLAGRSHEVRTRFVLGAPSGAVLHEETVTTEVHFRDLRPAEVRAYAATEEGLDKAGAYAIQGQGAALVTAIRGSYTNVVGLPVAEVIEALGRLGLL